jgi:energy-coupling factor transport system substrate-specific component
MRPFVRGLVYVLTGILGAVVFISPFLTPLSAERPSPVSINTSSPVFLALLGGLCLVALLLEMRDVATDAKFVALLGVLVALNAGLSFLETAIPGPGGFSPVFFLIIVSGYVFGGRFGFLMGALTIFVGDLISGGIGPWLPYKMLTAGWVGLTAPVPRLWIKRDQGQASGRRVELISLALFGVLWGLLYGLIMNLWFWPFATGPEAQHYQPGISVLAAIQRYGVFYAATSLIWDFVRAAGTAFLIFLLGSPTLRALRRFQRRFEFQYNPAVESAAVTQSGV